MRRVQVVTAAKLVVVSVELKREPEGNTARAERRATLHNGELEDVVRKLVEECTDEAKRVLEIVGE